MLVCILIQQTKIQNKFFKRKVSKNLGNNIFRKQMQRDFLKAMKQFFSTFEKLKDIRITQKTLSDGYIFMQFLSNVDNTYFSVEQLCKPNIQTEKDRLQRQHQNSLLILGKQTNDESIFQQKIKQNQKQLDLLTKIKNWRILIKKLKEYFRAEHQKGVKYGDIDIVDICNNFSMQQIVKVFELLLCVIVNCKAKQQYIGKIMDLEQSTQQFLADKIQKALDTRLCTLQTQEKNDLLQQLQSKHQENISLYEEIQRLGSLNQQLEEKIEEYDKMSETLQYEKKKIMAFNKKNSANQNQFNSYSLIDKQNGQDSSFMLLNGNWQQSVLEDSFSFQQQSFNKGGYQNIIETLKNRIIHQQRTHERQIQQMGQRIGQLQQRLQETSHFEQLLVIYQEKYQEALAYVEKVSQYEKQKNKICQEMMEKDIIIQELKDNIDEINEKLIQIQQQKIDLELLLAKKNNQKNNLKFNIVQPKSQFQEINNLGAIQSVPILKRNQTYAYPELNVCLKTAHHRQISQEITQKQDLSTFYPFLQPHQYTEQLRKFQVKNQSQSLTIKRLERKQKQMIKQNSNLKQKLQKMRKIQSQNLKLSNIVVELHTRKNQETELLVGCLYDTYNYFDFRFNKLIGSPCKSGFAGKQSNSNRSTSQDFKFNEITNVFTEKNNYSQLTSNAKSMNGIKKNCKRNPSLKIQGNDEILEVSMQNEASRLNIQK